MVSSVLKWYQGIYCPSMLSLSARLVQNVISGYVHLQSPYPRPPRFSHDWLPAQPSTATANNTPTAYTGPFSWLDWYIFPVSLIICFAIRGLHHAPPNILCHTITLRHFLTILASYNRSSTNDSFSTNSAQSHC